MLLLENESFKTWITSWWETLVQFLMLLVILWRYFVFATSLRSLDKHLNYTSCLLIFSSEPVDFPHVYSEFLIYPGHALSLLGCFVLCCFSSLDGEVFLQCMVHMVEQHKNTDLVMKKARKSSSQTKARLLPTGLSLNNTGNAGQNFGLWRIQPEH